MKEKEVSSGLKIFTFYKFVFCLLLPFLFALTMFSSWFGASVISCLEANMFCYCLLCTCLLKVFWTSLFSRRRLKHGSGLSSRITKSAVNSCYILQSTSYKLLGYFTLFIILLESTTSKMGRSSSSSMYSRHLINTIAVDAFELQDQLNSSFVSIDSEIKENTVIQGKNISIFILRNMRCFNKI